VIKMISIKRKIEETKKNAIVLITDLVGKGTPEDPFRPKIFDLGLKMYTHVDSKDIDYVNKTAKVYVNTLKTPKPILDRIRTELEIIAEIQKGRKI